MNIKEDQTMLVIANIANTTMGVVKTIEGNEISKGLKNSKLIENDLYSVIFEKLLSKSSKTDLNSAPTIS